MSDADAGANDDPNMTTITLKIPQAFLDDLDATWRAENFPSRSEFIRWALRDAIKHPSFSRNSCWQFDCLYSIRNAYNAVPVAIQSDSYINLDHIANYW